MKKIIFVLLMLVPVIKMAAQDQKVSKKQKKYNDYWEQQEKKEKVDVLFAEGNQLFKAGKHYEAITKYQKIFEIIPNDQQTVAKIKDIEIILANLDKEENVEEISRVFVSIEKLGMKSQAEISNTETNKTIVGEPQKIEEDPVKPIEKTIKVETEKTISIEKSDVSFRENLAKNYEEGLTETTYRKGNRTVTKRVLVRGKLGDEYLKVVHDWGGIYYFKNGEPTTVFTWDKESLGK